MISRVLKLIREFHRKNQSEMAVALEISNSYLSELESGKKVPTVELLQKYGAEFDIPASTLLMLSEKMESEGGLTPAQKKNIERIVGFLDWVSDEEDEGVSGRKRGARSSKAG